MRAERRVRSLTMRLNDFILTESSLSNIWIFEGERKETFFISDAKSYIAPK